MKYFLRNPDDHAITGPFEAEEVRRKLAAGDLQAHVLAAPAMVDDGLPPEGNSATAWNPIGSILGLVGEPAAPSAGSANGAAASQTESDTERVQFCPGCAHKLPKPLSPGDSGTCERCGKALTGAPPTPVLPAIVVVAPEGQPTERAFCPYCGQKTSGAVMPGETKCGQCGKLLCPAADAPAQRGRTPSGSRSLLTFIVCGFAGLLAQFGLFVLVCWFAALSGPSRSKESSLMFIYPVVYEVVSLAAGVFCLFFRNSTSRGLGFGILLGLGFTALLTATCAMKLTSR